MSKYLGIAAATMIGLAIPPSGCEAPAPSTQFAQTLAPEQLLVASPTTGPAHDRATRAEAVPAEIYRDLSVFIWYQRGQPLVFEARSYLPEGRPSAIAADHMRQAGAYRGVDFYVHDGDHPPYTTVYVPVYEGYWQPFVTAGDDAPRTE